MINKQIAGILGMDIPEEVVMDEIISIEPHEIVRVENNDLPPMQDIERKILQGEKELQEVIDASLGYQRQLFDEVSTIEPKYRSRYVEVANGTMHIALDAIKVKLKTQDEKKKQRLKEAEFKRPQNASDGETTNNFFFGSREELISAMRDDDSDKET